jgi:hypothetical protein
MGEGIRANLANNLQRSPEQSFTPKRPPRAVQSRLGRHLYNCISPRMA